MDEELLPPVERMKPSKAPSWVMLGFLLGALFVLALPRRAADAVPVPAAETSAPKPGPVEAPKIPTIEAVFFAWERNAVWSDSTTEVALWNPDTRKFSDCFEVLRVGDLTYFRSISALTRPVLTHGVPAESPLQFTETLRQREEWLAEVGKENMKSLSAGVRDALAPTAQKATGDGK